MMDANKYLLNGQLFQRFQNKAIGIDLEEISHKAWGGREVNTHINGSLPVDGV